MGEAYNWVVSICLNCFNDSLKTVINFQPKTMATSSSSSFLLLTVSVLLCLCQTNGQSHDLEYLPQLGSDIRGVASVRPHLHCPFFPRPGEEAKITATFFYAIKNYGNQPMRGFIDYSVCDSLENCETRNKRYYVAPHGHTDGTYTITLTQRYDPHMGGSRMEAHAEGIITGSVTSNAKVMCYYSVRADGYHHLRYDWTANVQPTEKAVEEEEES